MGPGQKEPRRRAPEVPAATTCQFVSLAHNHDTRIATSCQGDSTRQHGPFDTDLFITTYNGEKKTGKRFTAMGEKRATASLRYKMASLLDIYKRIRHSNAAS